MTDALNPGSAAALDAWASRVKANRDQAERVREGGPPRDFYAPVVSMFKADPRRTDEPALDVLRSLVRPGETWLDIGAGGGRYALALALRAKEVVCVEPSDAMLGVLREVMAEYRVANIQAVQSTWPMESDAPTADVALISHIGYDIEQIGPFLDAMEAASRRMCVAVLVAGSPPALAEPFWPPIHGEARNALPGLAEFVSLLLARGRLPEVRMLERPAMSYAERDASLGWLTQQLFVDPESDKGRKLATLAAAAMTERDGRFGLSWEPVPLGIVTWKPR